MCDSGLVSSLTTSLADKPFIWQCTTTGRLADNFFCWQVVSLTNILNVLNPLVRGTTPCAKRRVKRKVLSAKDVSEVSELTSPLNVQSAKWLSAKRPVSVALTLYIAPLYNDDLAVVNESHCCEPWTRGQSNLTKSASLGANFPVRGHPRGSKFVPLNSWGRVSYYCCIVTIGLGCTVWPQCTRVTTNQRPTNQRPTTSRHSLSQ